MLAYITRKLDKIRIYTDTKQYHFELEYIISGKFMLIVKSSVSFQMIQNFPD